MDVASTTSTLRPRRWRRVLKWGLRIGVFVVVVPVTGYLVADYLAARSLQAEVDRIRAAGEPTTFAEIARSRPRPPEDEDAGPYYGAAVLLLKATEEISHSRAAIGGDLLKSPPMTPQELLEAARPILKRNSLALDMVDRAAKLPGCHLELGMQYGVSVALPKFSQARNLARLCSLRTQWLARQGEAEPAAASAEAALHISRMFDADPILIVHLLKIACLRLLSEDVRVVLENGPLSDSALARLEQALQFAEQGIDFKKAVMAERVYTLAIMRNLLAEPRDLKMDSRSPSIVGDETLPPGLFVRRMAVQVLRKHEAFLATATQDWPAMARIVKSSPPPPPRSWLSSMVMADVLAPSFDRSVILSIDAVARLRTARVTVLIERFRLAQGRLPNDLGEVAAALQVTLPSDPYTGGSLLYRKDGEGYAVYSLGESDRDGGGQGLNKEEHGNVGIRLRLSPASQPSRTQP